MGHGGLGFFSAFNRLHSQNSVQNATKVLQEMLEAIDDLKTNPERHPIDKYKKSNDGTIRAFEKYKYRVAYQVKDDLIRIARFRNTKMKPKDF